MDQKKIETIEVYLLELGRTTPFLSGLDLDVIEKWEKKRIPLYIIFKGIRQGLHIFETYKKEEDEPFPRRISYFDKSVLRLFEKFKKQNIGEHSEDVSGLDGAKKRKGKDKNPVAPSEDELVSKFLKKIEELKNKTGNSKVKSFLESIDATRIGSEDPFSEVLILCNEINRKIVDFEFDSLENDEREKVLENIKEEIYIKYPTISKTGFKNQFFFEKMRFLKYKKGIEFIDLREFSK